MSELVFDKDAVAKLKAATGRTPFAMPKATSLDTSLPRTSIPSFISKSRFRTPKRSSIASKPRMTKNTAWTKYGSKLRVRHELPRTVASREMARQR